MRTDDYDLDEDIEALERELDEVFEHEPEHKVRFLQAIAGYLKSVPNVALLSDIPPQDIIRMYHRTGN